MSPASGLFAALKAVPGLRLWRKAPLAPFTTIGVGGPASALVTVASQQALASALALLDSAGQTFFCLGAGSNLLVSDTGYSGLVLKLDRPFGYVEGPLVRPEGKLALQVGASLPLPRLATFAAEGAMGGLEFACGIPGTVGGGVAMNAGAHGSSLADVVEAVEVAMPSGSAWLAASELRWTYRRCALPPGSVVSAVRMVLTAGQREEIVDRHRQLLRKRLSGQPRGVRTFGSTFKNPPGEAAGRLLDSAGLKGAQRGGAQVSTVHANFIVNTGDATAVDVLGLMDHMREAVRLRHGVLLEPEVRLLGTRFPWSD